MGTVPREHLPPWVLSPASTVPHEPPSTSVVALAKRHAPTAANHTEPGLPPAPPVARSSRLVGKGRAVPCPCRHTSAGKEDRAPPSGDDHRLPRHGELCVGVAGSDPPSLTGGKRRPIAGIHRPTDAHDDTRGAVG